MQKEKGQAQVSMIMTFAIMLVVGLWVTSLIIDSVDRTTLGSATTQYDATANMIYTGLKMAGVAIIVITGYFVSQSLKQ